MVLVGTFGVWDLFHVGHLNLLEKAKSLGDKLVVGVLSDERVEKDKGHPPVICCEQRERIIRSLKCVDFTVVYTKTDFTEWLKSLDIDILVVGGDWGNYGEVQQRYKRYMLERGRFVILPYTEGISTTRIKEQMTDRIIEDINES